MMNDIARAAEVNVKNHSTLVEEGIEEEFGDLAYHAPCHARNQGLVGQAIELLSTLNDIDPHDVGDSCSGISGTYGWKAESYETSMKIGEEMFEHMKAVPSQTGMTECPTCAIQMEHGIGHSIHHPLEVLETVFADEPDDPSEG